MDFSCHGLWALLVRWFSRSFSSDKLSGISGERQPQHAREWEKERIERETKKKVNMLQTKPLTTEILSEMDYALHKKNCC